MAFAEKLFTWINGITNPDLLEKLKKFSPSSPNINYESHSNGTHTLFDEIARMHWRWNEQCIAIEDIGEMSVSQATTVFSKRMIQRELVSVAVPLSLVLSVSASKSNLYTYPSLYAFGKNCYGQFRDEFNNLSEREYFTHCINGALKEGGTDFNLKLWAPSLQWSNSGGSHRFSTAYYISVEQGFDFTIKGNLSVYSLNYDWLEQLSFEYDAFIMSVNNTSDAHVLYEAFKINSYDSSSTFISLKSFPDEENECETIILLLNRKQKMPMIVRKWMDYHLQSKSIIPLIKVVNDLKAYELSARRDMVYIIEKDKT